MYWYFLLIHSRCPVQSVALTMSTTQQVEGIQYKFILFGLGLISILGEETIKVSTFRCFAERKSLEKPRNYESSKHTSGAPKKSWKIFTRKLWRFRKLFQVITFFSAITSIFFFLTGKHWFVPQHNLIQMVQTQTIRKAYEPHATWNRKKNLFPFFWTLHA